MMRTVVLILLMIAPFHTVAQKGMLSGKVTDSKTGEALPNVTVFLGNATQQTQTDEHGVYNLYSIRAGHYDLIVSMVGYEKYSAPVAVREDEQSVDISLVKKVLELGEVIVRPDMDQARYLEEFTAVFIGSSRPAIYRVAGHIVSTATMGASETRILNPQALSFDYDNETGELTGYTDEFLIIENKWLGYRLHYLVSSFTKNNRTQMISYDGQAYFQEMKGSDAQMKRWKKNRIEAYLGSAMHFYRSLLQNQLEFNGFTVSKVQRTKNPYKIPEATIAAKIREFKGSRQRDSLQYWVNKMNMQSDLDNFSHEALPAEKLVKRTDQPQLYALSFSDHLFVSHRQGHGHLTASILKLAEPFALFDLNGVLVRPKAVIYEGSWTTGVADLLPNDYVPETLN